MDRITRQQWADIASKAGPSPEEQEARFHAAMDRRNAQMSTGIPELDQALRGGLQAGLYVQENVTDVGGSAFLAQTARRLAESGVDVLYIAPAADPCEFAAGAIYRTSACSTG